MHYRIDQNIKDINRLMSRHPAIYYLVGTPLHTNIGDRAIVLSEVKFLKKNQRIPVVEVPYGFDLPDHAVRESDTIVLHGGGNFGDIWLNEEEYRRGVMEKFKNRKIVLMPQTIFFQDKKEMIKSSDIYKEARELTLIAREEQSYKIMKDNFSNNSILAPDIVLSLDVSSRTIFRTKRSYGLVVARSDKEKVVPDDLIYSSLQVFSRSKGVSSFTFSDMHTSDIYAAKESHESIVKSKINQFKGAKVVITDRLHGMIFALITGTPCIVFGSQTYKTSGVYEWIKQAGCSEFIKFHDGKESVEDLVRDLDLDRMYTYSPELFKDYWHKIAQLI